MPKLFLRALHTEDPGTETPSATRDRLKASFPPGSVRRMTQLGLLLGHCLGQVPFTGSEALVYASRFAEGRALEDFLSSFPAASPTLFQTSIHPSGAQQSMIARKRPVGSFFPMPGNASLAGQALLTALLCPEAQVLLGGGEECGTWLTEHDAASDRSFAFALLLTHSEETPAGAGNATAPILGELHLEQTGPADGALSLVSFFELLHARRPYEGPASPGWTLRLSWR